MLYCLFEYLSVTIRNCVLYYIDWLRCHFELVRLQHLNLMLSLILLLAVFTFLEHLLEKLEVKVFDVPNELGWYCTWLTSCHTQHATASNTRTWVG